MNFEVKVKLSNDEFVKVSIDRPELIYGATGIISSDIDDSLYGINPLTGDKLNIINMNEKQNRFFIPSHNQKDYEYAKENNLKLKQVVAPYFYGEGEESPREDIKTQVRYSVVAVIKNNENDTYLCEDAKGRNCKSFVMGGIEEGETAREAAIREIYEETGYSDVTIDFISNFKVVNHFYAGYKGVNRYAYLNIVFGHLNTDKCDKITKEEDAKHVVKWIEKKDLKDFINIPLNKYALDMLLEGETAYVEDGIMITDDENNGKLSKKVREDVIKKLNL